MTDSEVYLGLPDLQITRTERGGTGIVIDVEYTGKVTCPDCGSDRLRIKDSYRRILRHEGFGSRRCTLRVRAHKWLCCECLKYFRQQFPGILRWQRATEPYRRYIFEQHRDGISRSRLAEREHIGHGTVERYFLYHLTRQAAEFKGAPCPRVLGIDEHFFSRKEGYATTFCDLARHRVHDVVRGRSEASLESYLNKLEGKEKVRVVCMDLSATYRAIVRNFFPNALIVTDRFHVVRLVGQQFFALWKSIDPAGMKKRGLVSLLRRHAERLSQEQSRALARYFSVQPAIGVLYEFRERLMKLLLVRGMNARACRSLARQLLGHIEALKESKFAILRSLGETLDSWKNEIGRMWRFSRSNGITEGFHTKMEALQRQAYGFRNFRNYRLRVVVMCS